MVSLRIVTYDHNSFIIQATGHNPFNEKTFFLLQNGFYKTSCDYVTNTINDKSNLIIEVVVFAQREQLSTVMALHALDHFASVWHQLKAES